MKQQQQRRKAPAKPSLSRGPIAKPQARPTPPASPPRRKAPAAQAQRKAAPTPRTSSAVVQPRHAAAVPRKHPVNATPRKTSHGHGTAGSSGSGRAGHAPGPVKQPMRKTSKAPARSKLKVVPHNLRNPKQRKESLRLHDID